MWKEYYPWNPVKDVYKNQVVQSLPRNAHIADCVFKGITDSKVVYVENEILILFERCLFIECTKENIDGSILEFHLSSTGSLAMYKVSIEICQNLHSSGFVIFAEGNDEHAGSFKINHLTARGSVSEKSSTATGHIHIKNNYQEAKDCNITGSSVGCSVICHDCSANAVAERLYIVSNVASVRPSRSPIF